MAFTGSHSPRYSNFLHTSYSYSIFRCSSYSLELHLYQTASYLGFFPSNKLYKISPKLHHFPPLHQSYSRKEQVILNRLLIGRTHLTHSFRPIKEHPPNCDHCKSPLTAEHILTSCSAYKNIREKHHHSQLSHILINISKQHILTAYQR